MAAKKKEAKPERKSGGEAPSMNDRAAALMEDINKKMRGRASLMSASDYVLPYLTRRLPTGLLSLDIALGGGWPAGGVSQVIGRRNAGKSYLMWMTICQLQHILGKNMRVLLAMTEIPADRSQARLAGVKISMGEDYIAAMSMARASNGWPPLTKEEVADLRNEVGMIHELHAMSAEDFYDVILRAVDENIYHLIVLDSIGNLLADAEQENESVHDKTYGGTSGPNTTFLKKLTNMLTMRNEHDEVRKTCILGLNQVRDNIKDPNRPYKAPGGNALEHAKLVDVYVESGAPVGSEEKVFTQTSDGMKTTQRFVQTGKNVNWRIEKGKAGIHEGARGTYLYDFRTNAADYYTDSIIVAVGNGIIESAGAWLSVLGPDGKPVLRCQGKDRLIEALHADAVAKAGSGEESMMDYIRDESLKRAGIDIDYKWKD